MSVDKSSVLNAILALDAYNRNRFDEQRKMSNLNGVELSDEIEDVVFVNSSDRMEAGNTALARPFPKTTVFDPPFLTKGFCPGRPAAMRTKYEFAALAPMSLCELLKLQPSGVVPCPLTLKAWELVK